MSSLAPPGRRALIPLVFFGALLPFVAALGYGFVWDDASQIVSNPRLGIADIPGYWRMGGRAFAGVGPAAKYDPLGWSLFALERGALGHPSPGLSHLTSLALHGLCAVLVFLLAWRMLAGRSAAALPAAVAGALTFAWLPVQSEVVVWISARFDALALGILLAGLNLTLGGGPGRRLAGGLVAASALLAKDAALGPVLAAPLALAMVDRGASARARALGIVGAVAGALLCFGLRAWAVGAAPAGLEQLALGDAAAAWLHILGLGLMQPELSLLRPAPSGLTLPGALALGALLAGAIVAARQLRRGEGGVGIVGLALWASAGILAAVAASLIDVLPDRYAYLGGAGVGMMVAGGLGAALPRLPERRRALASAGVALVLLSFAARDALSLPRLSSDVALFSWERALWPDAPQTAFYLASALAGQGRFPEALALVEEVHAAAPHRVDVLIRLGRLRAVTGDAAGAQSAYAQAVAMDPTHPELPLLRAALGPEAGGPPGADPP